MKYIKVIIYILVLLSLSIDCKESVDDDSGISQDLLMDGIFQCANTVKRTCSLNSKPRMNETLSCLQNNFHELQKDCMKVFNGLLKNVLASCGYDLLITCQAEAATLSPAEGVSCLFKHYGTVSSSCRAQLDLLASYAVPCGTEAATYCSDKNNPQDIFDCLSTIRKFNATSIFDPVCNNVILGYQNCLPKSNAENIISNHDDNPFRNQKIISFNDDSESNSEYDYSDNSIPDDVNAPLTDDAYMEDDIEYSESAYATSEDDDTYDESDESTWFGGNGDDDDDDNVVDDDDNVVDDDDDDDDLGSGGSYENENENDDDYGYTNRQQPKSKPKPKPKAKPKPKTGGGDSSGGGKSKPLKSPVNRLQEKPQKPSMIKISELKVDKISSVNRNLQSSGGSKPKPKAKPGPGKGGDGNEGDNEAPPFLPPPSNGKPCWAVDDQLLSQGKSGSNKNDDTTSNGDSRDIERGGLIAFIGFVFSLTILGALTYLWCKNGRSFSNLTVQRAAEIVSEKDPYESGYAPTAADDHDDEGPSDRMLQEPEEDSGSIEMSDLKISSTVPTGYAKLTINEENV
jgi:hypothetical protein